MKFTVVVHDSVSGENDTHYTEAAFTENQRLGILYMVRHAGKTPEQVRAEEGREAEAGRTGDGMAANHKAAQREIAVSSGFTGDTCSQCGSFNMKRNGACLVCTACGSTTGCS